MGYVPKMCLMERHSWGVLVILRSIDRNHRVDSSPLMNMEFYLRNSGFICKGQRPEYHLICHGVVRIKERQLVRPGNAH